MQNLLILVRGQNGEDRTEFTRRMMSEASDGLLALHPACLKVNLTENNPPKRSVIPFRAIISFCLFAVIAGVVVAAFYFIDTPVFKNVFARMVQPFEGPEPFTYTRLNISPGSTYVQRAGILLLKPSYRERFRHKVKFSGA